MLIVEKSGVCLFLRKDCHLYVNQLGVVKEKVQQLHISPTNVKE